MGPLSHNLEGRRGVETNEGTWTDEGLTFFGAKKGGGALERTASKDPGKIRPLGLRCESLSKRRGCEAGTQCPLWAH